MPFFFQEKQRKTTKNNEKQRKTTLQDKKLLDHKKYLLQRIEHVGTDKALAEYIKQHPKKFFYSKR